MGRLVTTFLFLCCFSQVVFSQVTIYWANGNRFPFRLVGANEDQVFYTAEQNSQTSQRAYSRENILMAFNAQGGYLMVTDISTNAEQAKQQLAEFYNAPGLDYDLLLKAAPLTVITGKISYQSDEVINYLTREGTPASINRRDLAAVIYRDGKHTFIMPVTEAATLLAGAAPNIKQLIKPKTSVPVARQNVQSVDIPKQAQVMAAPKADKKADEFQVNLPVATSTSLSKEQLAQYRQQSLQKVDDFVGFLNIITDKSAPASQKEKAVEQATKLFLPDAMIEVSSNARTGTRKYTVSAYLNRLKLLPYSSAKVDWNEVNFVKELTQAVDGNYYGTISGQQTFTGYGPNGKNVLYSDVTEKNVKVKLQSYQKSVSGQQQMGWEVLLGNVGLFVQ